jgi:6-phosphogluconolactonase
VCNYPSGRFVYVVSLVAAGNVSAFAIDPTTRALNAVAGSPYTAGADSISIVTDPAGKFVYVANYGGNSVSAYAINSISGVLKEVTGSPFTAGANPSSVAVDPTGRFALSPVACNRACYPDVARAVT